MEDHGPVRSVARAADILASLQDGPRSLGRISARTGLSKPTAHRLLASLAYRQMVIQDPETLEYLLGPGSLRVADAIMRGAAGISAVLMPIMRDLEAATAETVALYVRAGLERICIGQVPSAQAVRFTAHVGAAHPLHIGSMGKVLLAFTEERERMELLDRLPLSDGIETSSRVTGTMVTNREQLEDVILRIRQDGYASTRGERAVGVAAISAPVFGPDGHVISSLAVLGPESRFDDASSGSLRSALLASAAACTERLSRPQVAVSA